MYQLITNEYDIEKEIKGVCLMKFISKHFSEKGITLIFLLVIIIILVTIISMIVKGVFDSKTIGANKEPKENYEELIGKYIEYIPEEGIYNTVTNNQNYTGSANNDHDFITDTSLKFRIWSIDDNKITLVSDKPAEVGGYKNIGALHIANCIGYNNSVKILNEICETCYSNTEIGAVGRSLNIEDIEKTLDKSVWNPEEYKERKEYKKNLYYPSIYSLETYSNIDGVEIDERKYYRKKRTTNSLQQLKYI